MRESCVAATKSQICSAAIWVMFWLIATLFAISAEASDGVALIDQTCAEAGCFAGDSPGFPVTIDGSAGKSYRLSSDIAVPASRYGIVIESGHVTVDLNGFSITTAGAIPRGAFWQCPEGASPYGIYSFSTDWSFYGNYPGIVVKNGSVLCMKTAIFLGNHSTVSDVKVLLNTGYGIRLGDGAIVSDSSAAYNGGTGINVGEASRVTGNTSYDNGSNGISVGGFSIVSGNTTVDNSKYGIYASQGSVVQDNASSENRWDGIIAYGGSLVRDNAVRQNRRHGLNLTDHEAGYQSNVISNNYDEQVYGKTGEVTGMGQNVCDGRRPCP